MPTSTAQQSVIPSRPTRKAPRLHRAWCGQRRHAADEECLGRLYRVAGASVWVDQARIYVSPSAPGLDLNAAQARHLAAKLLDLAEQVEPQPKHRASEDCAGRMHDVPGASVWVDCDRIYVSPSDSPDLDLAPGQARQLAARLLDLAEQAEAEPKA